MAGSNLRKSLAKSLNPIEAGKAVGDALVKQGVIAGWEDTWAQVYGKLGEDHHKLGKDKSTPHKEEKKEAPKSLLGGDLAPGEWLDLIGITSPAKSSENAKQAHQTTQEEQPKEKYKNAEPGINYHREIVQSSETSNRRQLSEMEQKFEQIHDELKRLVESSNKIVQEEFAGVTLESTPKEVGKYHVNFLEWMLFAIQTARQKVEDSGAWLSAMKSKKDKKGYWGMFKKHGTSFGMSNERQVATQTG